METGDLIKGRYELVRFLGSGSFGEVWQAHDRMIGKDVALKIYLTLDPAGVDEFKREYANTLDLSSPYLLTPHYFDVWERRPFLVMKYCERGSSAKLAGHIAENELWKFVHDVAAGLDVLHSQREPMVHQDIKPDNILVDGDGRFLITDFGISKRLRATMRKQSSRDVTSGATPYMAPERFESTAMLSTASDVWSLGASIYELATGELPFSGFGGGMQRSGAEMPSLDGNWSADLNRLMRSCLARNASDRPTAKQVADLSGGILNGKPVRHVGEATGKGCTYQGELLDGKPHGKGIMHFDNGNTYEGDFVNGLFNGKGKFVFRKENINNCDYYEGNWKDGKRDGQGKLVWKNGSYYVGNWKDDKRNGQGKEVWANGGYYEGNWKDGNRNGQGKFVWADGGYYEGNWKDGNFNGQGKRVWANGDYYVGNWKDNNRDGQGKYVYAHGGYDEGNWKDDKLNGYGRRLYTDGYYYEGNWKDDKRNGYGKLIDPNGKCCFEGNWKDNNFNGYGKHLYTDGYYYEGNWKDDKRNGYGKLIDPNGKCCFEGNWKDDEKIITAEWLRENTTIGGWLLLLLLTLLLGGLATLLGEVAIVWKFFPDSWPHFEGWWDWILGILGICVVIFVLLYVVYLGVYQIYSVVAFHERKPNAGYLANRCFQVYFFYPLFTAGMVLIIIIIDTIAGKLHWNEIWDFLRDYRWPLLGVVAWMIWAGFCLSYLEKSEQVDEIIPPGYRKEYGDIPLDNMRMVGILLLSKSIHSCIDHIHHPSRPQIHHQQSHQSTRQPDSTYSAFTKSASSRPRPSAGIKVR